MNRGERTLAYLIEVAPQVKVITDDPTGYLEVHIMGHGYADITGFVVEHLSHEMVVYDEYGREYDNG